jgi:ceramide glucosyltransferase
MFLLDSLSVRAALNPVRNVTDQTMRFVGEQVVGPNPKINNLVPAYLAVPSSHSILWILDSNVLTLRTCLSSSISILVAPTPPGARPIGLIHHLPWAIYPDMKLGSRLEQVFLCSTHAKMYLSINWCKIASCVMGKSCLFRKSDLERAVAVQRQRDGLEPMEGMALAAFGQYLGEDNMVGEAIWNELGMRHAMGSDIAGNTVGSMSTGGFCSRRVRWIRVRKYMVTCVSPSHPSRSLTDLFSHSASTLIEPLTECFVLGALMSPLLSYLTSIPTLLLLFIHIVTWFTFDVLIFKSLSHSAPPSSVLSNSLQLPVTRKKPAHDGPGFGFACAWVARESLALPIWLFAIVGNTVVWRDNGVVYRVLMGGTVEEVKQDGGGSARWERGVLGMLGCVRARAGYTTVRVVSPDLEDNQ